MLRTTEGYFPLLLALIVLIEGFVSISIEILTIRQLLPVVGGSVLVTSLVIGIFLLFLALGYHRGGRHYQAPRKILQRNFFIAAVWIGIGLSYIFISFFFYYLEKIIGPSLFITLAIYLLLIIAPLIFILGQTIPIVMNMIKTELTLGRLGGSLLGLSTFGSFTGAVLTTLVLMASLGVAWTIFINFLVLMSLVLLLSPRNFALYLNALIILCLGGMVYMLNIKFETNLFALTNNYANYQILDHSNAQLRDDEKILVINDAYSSFINDQKQGFPYIQIIKKLLLNDLKLENANILVLGAGGFSLSAENPNNNHFTYVDIDGALPKVVTPHFVQAYNGELITDDARHFLRINKRHYAAIVVDAYSSPKTIPAHLLTTEYITQIREHLTEQGIAIFNIIGNPFFTDHYSKHVDNTIRAAFGNCALIPEVYANKNTNLIYACTRSPNAQDHHAYTDNLSNASIEYLMPSAKSEASI